MVAEKDLILMKLAQYFVTKYEYKFVEIKQNNHEIWLGSNLNEEFPVIRISLTSASSVILEKQRLRNTTDAICEFFQMEGKLLDIHIDDEIIEMDDTVEWTQVGISKKAASGVDITSTFPDFKEVIVEITDEDEQSKTKPGFGSFDIRNKFKKNGNSVPVVTYSILLICLIVFIMTNVIASSISEESASITASIVMGGYYKAFIVGAHEFFRFLTGGFVHYDLFHFLMNSMALVSLGGIIEKLYKRSDYIVILLSSIIFGSIFVFAGQGNVLTVGISGGLYGLMAALLVYGFESKIIYNPAVARSFITTLLINLLITFMPGISMFGHIGGFIGGLFIAIVLTKKKSWESLRKNAVIAFALMSAILGYRCVQNYTVTPMYLGTDIAVLEYLDSVGLSGYSDHMKGKLSQFYGINLEEVSK